MNTEEIIEKLETYNRWRRGVRYLDHAQSRDHLGDVLDAAISGLRELIKERKRIDYLQGENPWPQFRDGWWRVTCDAGEFRDFRDAIDAEMQGGAE